MMRRAALAVAVTLALAVPGLGLAADPPAAQTQPTESQAPPAAKDTSTPAPKIEEVVVPTGPPAELKKLAILEGQWTTKSHAYESAMGPESHYAGKASYKWIFKGMHLEGEHSYQLTDKPNTGRSTWGWDPERKQYQIVWVDAMFPAAMVYYGTFASDSVLVCFTTYMIQGKAISEKLTFTFTSKDSFQMAMENDMAGQMKTLMEVEGTRVKAAKPASKPKTPAKKPASATTKKTG